MEPAKQWKLKLYGGFELIAPDGKSVRLPYRSAQALVAVLALNRDEGLSRDELGKILWPGSPAQKRQENLRQAIAAAKAAVGPALIEATRTHCRVANEFQITTDHEDPGIRGPGSFMPGFEGEWFDRVGRRANAVPTGRLMDSFLHLLLWMAEHDPGKMVGLMRDNHGLAFGLAYSDRRLLLEKAPDEPNLAGWKKFFAVGLDATSGASLTEVTRRHREVVSEAEKSCDRHLAVHASSQVSLYNAWQNNLGEAIEIADWCLATAASCSDKSVWATATQMKGNILVQLGRFDEGLELLERAEQMYRDPIDSAIMRALRADYLAVMGRHADAAKLLALDIRPNLGAGHAFLNIVWGLASAVVTCKDKQSTDAVEEFERVVAAARVYGDAAILTMAIEELAKMYARVGEDDLAASHMSQARRIRRAHSRLYTPWDKQRLAS